MCIRDRDSAAYVPRSVVVADGFDWAGDRHPGRPLSDSIIYETHVRSLTMGLPGLPEALRGTYAALAHPATLDYLTALGVTAVELLPIHAFTTEPETVSYTHLDVYKRQGRRGQPRRLLRPHRHAGH